MPRLASLTALVTAGVLLAACEEAPYASLVHYKDPGDKAQVVFRGATARGPLLVEVFGEHPSMSPDASARMIRQAIKNGWARRVIEVTADPAQATSSGRVLVGIDVGQGTDARRFCAGQWPEPASAGPEAKIRMVLCSGKQRVSEVSGWMEGSMDLSSPHFPKLIGQMTRQMLKEEK